MSEKILCVDDNAVDRKLLVGILGGEGYETVEALDGREAIERALREEPDLILLDIVMPGIDGYEVCTELKAHSRTTHIPIIFCSARGEVRDRIMGLEMGAADYMTKPFDKGEVLARVRAHLKIRNLASQLIEANHQLLAKQKHLNEDLMAAATIQRSLLPPTSPEVEGLAVAWTFKPCRRVGGDIFNLLRLDEDHWAIYMLDVSGHGVPSAMVAVSVSQMLRPETGTLLKKSTTSPPHYHIVSPEDVLTGLDRAFPFDRFNRFFTMSYLVLNTRDGRLRYSNAAHPPPLLLRREGRVEPLAAGGTVIGLGNLLPFKGGEKSLRLGDKLFVYTDGILEYHQQKGAFYGMDRLFMALQRSKDKPIARMIDEVIESLLDFGNRVEPRDDVSLLGLELKGRPNRPRGD